MNDLIYPKIPETKVDDTEYYLKTIQKIQTYQMTHKELLEFVYWLSEKYLKIKQ